MKGLIMIWLLLENSALMIWLRTVFIN